MDGVVLIVALLAAAIVALALLARDMYLESRATQKQAEWVRNVCEQILEDLADADSQEIRDS